MIDILLATKAWGGTLKTATTRRAYSLDLGLDQTFAAIQSDARRGCGWLLWCERQSVNPLQATTDDITDWLIAIGRADFAASTANRMLSAVSSFYTWLVDHYHLSENPTQRIRRLGNSVRPAAREWVLTPDQAVQLLDGAAAEARRSRSRTSAILATLLTTGMRLPELTALRLRDLDTHGAGRYGYALRIGGPRPRRVPLARLAAERLDNYLLGRFERLPGQMGASDRRMGEPLFATRNGRHIQVSTIERTLYLLAKRATGELQTRACELKPTVLRWTAIDLARSDGASFEQIQTMLGEVITATTPQRLAAAEGDPFAIRALGGTLLGHIEDRRRVAR
ncbi:tyrosine recombinase XerC [Kutzneria sp. 744]|nr:tyrosine recombinase XerC [Kutzneria sp. 744]